MLLNITNVTKAFGPDHILTGVTMRIDAREKVALVGRNGTGKTTLLKILTGQYAPDSGSVHLARGARVGYLRQEVPIDEGVSVLEEAQSSKAKELEMKRRLEELEAKIEQSATEEDLEEYALLHEHFLESEGYSTESDIRTILIKMGFTEDEFDKPTSKLSGGEKTRLAIAKLLLEEPDLMILDEPTNHLDLQATEWLEGWIRGYHGAVLLVSHDRTFLDSTSERVIEMKDGQVKSYPGPFPKFLQLRAEEDARLAEVAKRQDIEIAKMDEYVRRFMNSQRTAQARGRLKLMNRLIEGKVEAPKNDKGMKGAFAAGKRSGDLVLETEKLTVGFADGVNLFKNLNWTVRNGDRWGVIGENGSGKSTLIKVALGLLDPVEGRARLGSNVVCGYFSQDVSDIDVNQTPLDFMVYECDMLPADARNLLGRYLISGDDVYRPIKTFSGGEKNKLALARLTNLNPNLLILDEPTNHLDMASRDALAEILKEYKGTLILVSHDRWLLSNVTDHILDVRKAGPIQYPGSYTEYKSGKAAAPPPKSSSRVTEEPKSLEIGLSPRELSKEISRLTKLVAELEIQVSEDERHLRETEVQLANVEPSADIYSLTQQHSAIQERLAGTMSAWEENSVKLEKMSALQG
ncbi:MAG: ABC-F family ATP-binding cassette domain-containing protein [Chlorobia bacterium]|nr:ABC-F family ATP-binding cassette domain-containing protein [Fimbriimonadaceae bacterium]